MQHQQQHSTSLSAPPNSQLTQPPSPQTILSPSTMQLQQSQATPHPQHSANWKSQIIQQIQQRNQKEVKSYADIFTAYSRMLHTQRALKTRVFQLEQEVMTTRQLSSLAATPMGMSGSMSMMKGGGDFSGTGNASSTTIKILEEKILKLQEDLTSAYRLQSENSNTFLRVKEQAEKDEKALLKKEEELAEKTKQVIQLQKALEQEKENSIQRNKHLEQTCELLRSEVQSSRLLVKNQEAKIQNLAVENDTLLTQLLKLKEQQSNEQNELNVVRQELLKANHEAKIALEQKRLIEEGKAIAPTEVDLSDMNSIIDHVAWTSNFNVVVPNDRKRTIRGHRGPVTCIRYNTAGTLFASAGVDGLVKIYDARTGSNRASLRGSKESVMNVAFSPDDSLMLASGNDSISRVWSLKNSKVLHTLVGHSAKIWAATFTGDGKNVCTGSHDRMIKIWDVEDGVCKRSISCQSSCNYLSMNRNDNILASAHLDTNIRLWSIKTGELMHGMDDIHSGQATSVEFSRDGGLIVTCSRDNTVKITDIRTYKVLKVLEGSTRAPFRNLINWNRAIFSPDDRHVVVGGHVGELFFWNVESGKLEAILPGVSMSEGIYGAGPQVQALSSTSSPSSLASSATSSAALVAAANTIGEQAISCVDWNRNGRQVMSCDQGGNIHVWEHDANLPTK